MPTLRDRIVVITGASAGIGAALAQAFAAAGARCVLAARRADALARVAAACRTAGAPAADVVPTDVADPAQVEALVAGAVARHGRCDVMVNNAGVAAYGRFDDQDAATLARLTAVNLNGTLYGCRAALPVMRQQGHGHLINVSSAAGLVGLGGLATYCATKFAQVGLGQALRSELRGTGIWVTTVLPVATRTELFAAAYKGPAVTDVGAPWPRHTAAHVARRVVRAVRRRRPPAQVLMFRPYRWLLLPVWLIPGLADWLPLRVPLRRAPPQA